MQEKKEELIVKILSGESTPSDEIEFIEWFMLESENPSIYAAYERIWDAADIILNRHNFKQDKAFEKFRQATMDRGRTEKGSDKFRRISNKVLKLAAAIILLVASTSTITYFIIERLPVKEGSTNELVIPAGSRGNLVLSDGTSVWLNAESRLTYPDNFSDGNRTVHLEGEGYFDVIKNSGTPFTVITSKLEITALGTSFNVKSYPDEGIEQATLISGSLLITRTKHKQTEQGVVLEPNQQITYYSERNSIVINDQTDVSGQPENAAVSITENQATSLPPRIIINKSIDPEVFTSWKDNRLIFDNETFESIAVKLERRYGARIIIEDEKIRNKRFKGRFDEITIEQALTALQFASPFEYKIRHDTIYITSQ